MSEPMSQSVPSRKSASTSISVGLILITILSLVLVGYTVVNPHVTTVTQPQLVTNTQNIYVTQTVTSIGTQTVTSTVKQTVSSVGTVTSVAVASSTASGSGYNNYNQICGYYGCYNSNPSYYSNGSPYLSCQSTGSNNTVRCSGYLYQPDAGCVELAVPIDNAYWADARIYQYYALRNLPSSYVTTSNMAGWNWVTVTGQITQAYSAPIGSGCSGNYINVSSISP